jgi:hypothetical protein
MKNTRIILLLLTTLLTLPVLAVASRKAAAEPPMPQYFLQLSGLALDAFDANFNTAYGTWHLAPEATAGLRLIDALYIYGGYAWMHSALTIADTGDVATIDWHMLRAGFDYRLKLGRTWRWSLHAGAVMIDIVEALAGNSAKNWVTGFEGGTSLHVMLGRRTYLGLECAYIYGRATIDTAVVEPGGLCFGLTLGTYL